jgi:hypothetical protein
MRRQKASWVGGLTLPGPCRAAAAPHQPAGGSCGVLAAERPDEARATRGRGQSSPSSWRQARRGAFATRRAPERASYAGRRRGRDPVRAQIGEGRAAGDPQQQRAQRGGKELGVDPKELGGAEMLLLLAGRRSKRAMLGGRVDEIW